MTYVEKRLIKASLVLKNMLKAEFDGLTNDEVTLSRFEYGTNELPSPEVESFWEKLWVSNFLFIFSNIF